MKKTTKAIVVTCKCGSKVAASMIIGGYEIDGDFTDTMAEVINRGGEVSIDDINENPISLNSCKCGKEVPNG